MPQDDPFAVSRLVSYQDSSQIFEIAKQIMLDTMQNQMAVDTVAVSSKDQVPSLQSFKCSQDEDFASMAKAMHDNLLSQKSIDIFGPINDEESSNNHDLPKIQSSTNNRLSALAIKIAYEAKCIVAPATVVQEPGKKFTATWIFQNTGECPWKASEISLVQINGQEMNLQVLSQTLPTMQINPQCQFSIICELTFPEQSQQNNEDTSLTKVNSPFQFRLHTLTSSGDFTGFGEVVTL